MAALESSKLSSDVKDRPSLYEQEAMKDAIKQFTMPQYQALLKIIRKHTSDYTQNVNGVFVNLKDVPTDGLLEMNSYIKYIEKINVELTKKREK